MIKAALSADLHELAELARHTYAQAYAADLQTTQLEDHLAQNLSDTRFAQMMQTDRFYLYRRADSIIAFVQVGTVTPSYAQFVPDFAAAGSEIRRLYVSPDAQNEGVGSQLLEHALNDELFRTTDCTYLTTWQDNFGAQRLYARHGFSKVGQIPELNTNGEVQGFEHIMVRSNI